MVKMQPRFARTPSRNKYGAKKTQVGEVKFDSKKEATRWMELQLLERGGEISDLRRQVRIPLMGQHRPLYTRTGRKMVMTVDFYYIEDGAEVYEDSKGAWTRDFEVRYAVAIAMGLNLRIT
jgi:hypothetical protein